MLPIKTTKNKKPIQSLAYPSGCPNIGVHRRRWKVERTFAWLGNFRRLVVRWDRLITVYRAFFHLACLIITLRQL